MSYRFQKFTTTYPTFVRQFLAGIPDYKNLSYSELYRRFIDTHYGLSNYYAKHLELLGAETQDIFVDVEALQKKWADEHGVKYSNNGWLYEIILAQVRDFQPDVLYLQDLYLFDERCRNELRTACKDRVRIIGWQAAPTEDYARFKDLDLVLTCVPNFADSLRAKGASVDIIRHAFESSILNVSESNHLRDLDFTFIGTVLLREGFHLQRQELLQELLRSTPLQVWSEIHEPRRISRTRQVVAGLARRMNFEGRVAARLRNKLEDAGNGISGASRSASVLQRRFSGRVHGPVFGFDYFQILARSKATLNNHLDSAGDFAGNMRLFEATGMGACLITDWKVNLSELFEPDVEVLTYKTPAECTEKVNYILEHQEEREKIAAAGQRRTLRDHTFEQRARQLDGLIRGIL